MTTDYFRRCRIISTNIKIRDPQLMRSLTEHRDELSIIDVGYQVIVQKTKLHHPPCLLDPEVNRGEIGTLQSTSGSSNHRASLPGKNASLLQRNTEKGVRAVERILRSSEEEFASRSFLLSCFADYGIPIMSSPVFAPWLTLMNPSGFGALQLPTEFVDFLRVISKLDMGRRLRSARSVEAARISWPRYSSARMRTRN